MIAIERHPLSEGDASNIFGGLVVSVLPVADGQSMVYGEVQAVDVCTD